MKSSIDLPFIIKNWLCWEPLCFHDHVYACIPEALVKLIGSKMLTIEYMKDVEQEYIT